MRTLKIAALKDDLSATLRAVQRGEHVLVTDRSRPVAVLAPVDDEDGVTILPRTRSFASVRGKRYPAARRRSSSLHALLAERGER